ncbi:MAG: AAA family ATPase [Muribaculaceae bacterium]|nr:AAA family ATPase [Muribaculaceae bacterium]
MNDFGRYKCLLEYFVSHLDWVQNNDPTFVGYNKYIKPITNFISTGLGYSGQSIQQQVADWSQYDDYEICINITCSFGKYTTKQCYLNWKNTWLNTRPKWKNNKIIGLYLSEQQYASASPLLEYSLDELGLFDNDEPNNNLKLFYNQFKKLIIEYENTNNIMNYVDLLKSNKNLILTGAPGTGKTYLAKQIANQLIKENSKCNANEQIGFVQFHPSYDYTDFIEGLRAEETDNGDVIFRLHNGIFKEFCSKALSKKISKRTFDECYEEFIELDSDELDIHTLVYNKKLNYRINSRKSIEIFTDKTSWVIKKELLRAYVMDNEVSDWKPYVLAIGDRFKKMYDEDLKINGIADASNKFVFIIDEINRGEISKIFGELFFSIDPGYRGTAGKVKTQFANIQSHETNTIFDDNIGKGWFYVPENVYIIGTMNDIDRSVESMDFAMRRRFAWHEVTADESTLMWNGQIDNWKDEAKKRMKSLNSAIEEIQGLNSSYHIGAAYFLKLKNYNGDFDKLWNIHIRGVVYEYLRGLPDAVELETKLLSAYNLVP